MFLKRRPKNKDLRPHGLKRRPNGLKRRPHRLKLLMLTAEGNARSRNFVTAIWECCGISSAVFSCGDQVYHLPFLQVSLKIGSSSVSCGYNVPSVKRIGVTSPKVISVAMGGLTIKKAYDRICLEDFRQTYFGRVVGGLGEEGFHWLSDILWFKIQCRMIWVSSRV